MVNNILVIIHLIGLALGVGGATASDFFFFKSIRDKKITTSEFSFLHAASRLVWAGLIILFLSGVGFIVMNQLQFPGSALLYTEKMKVKLMIVGLIFLNGLIMHLFFFPFMKKHRDKEFAEGDFLHWAPIVSTQGAISVVSWYSALVIGGWRRLDLDFGQLLSIYLFLLAVAIIGANLLTQFLIRFVLYRRHS